MWCPISAVSEEKKRLLEAGFRQWTKERFMQWRRLGAARAATRTTRSLKVYRVWRPHRNK